MSEKTREVPQLADTTYAHTLVINPKYEHRLRWQVGVPLWFSPTLPLIQYNGNRMRKFSKLGNTASKQPGSLCLVYFAIFPIKWAFYDLSVDRLLWNPAIT